MLIESCFQAAGLTSMDLDSAESLPVGAKRILIAGEIPEGSLTVTSVRKGSETNGTFVHESVIRLDGSPIMRIDGLKMKKLRDLSDDQRPGLAEYSGELT